MPLTSPTVTGQIMSKPPKTLVVLQDECYKHKYIRSKDTTNIVERPERLRALKVGLAAAIARLEERYPKYSTNSIPNSDVGDELSVALDKLSILAKDPVITDVCQVIRNPVNLKDLSSHPAVKMIHAANEDGTFENLEHLDRLAKWARESEEKIKNGESEIPSGYLQGDLYSQ